jgi:hypothetical protein
VEVVPDVRGLVAETTSGPAAASDPVSGPDVIVGFTITRLLYRSYAVTSQAGGLEGHRPSKNHSFLVVFAGFAGKYYEK